eukprot:scaffold177242_cov22-Tisochrysis_lutea.AAC.3
MQAHVLVQRQLLTLQKAHPVTVSQERNEKQTPSSNTLHTEQQFFTILNAMPALASTSPGIVCLRQLPTTAGNEHEARARNTHK